MSLTKWHRFRGNFAFLVILLGFVALECRLVKIQYIDGEWYSETAKKQQQRKIEIPAPRGRILDRRGRDLAISVESRSIYAHPRKVIDKPRTARFLGKTLQMNPRKIYDLLKKDANFVWIKRKASVRVGDAVKSKGIEGLGIQTEIRRVYPKGPLASQVLGIVGVDNNGLEGIEFAMEKVLAGKPGYRHVQLDGRSRWISTPGQQDSTVIEGKSVVLTIDSVIQHIVEEELDAVCMKWGPKGAVAIVMDPETGDVLAMASRPTYNPNKYNEYPADARRNRAVCDVYEPGSIFKPIVVAAALQERVVTPSTGIFCENGVYRTAGRTLNDHHPYGNENVATVLIKSSNIGMAKIGERLGASRLHDYLRRFGFGSRTRIGLPGEEVGILRPLRKWSRCSVASLAMGQEIGVTPIQMVTAFSSIANGGVLVRPRILKAVLNRDGQADGQVIKTERLRRVARYSRMRGDLTRMLVGVVQEGTGKNAWIPEYDIAGKTGTAQKHDPKTGQYSHTKFVSSFVAFAPADRPEICVLIMVDEPYGSQTPYGGAVAAKPVSRIIKRSLNYMGVMPNYQEAGLRRGPRVNVN